MIIGNLLIITSLLLGPFMPNVTMDQYEKMALDFDKTRIAIRTVMPQNTIEGTARCNKVLVQMDRVIKAVEDYDAVVSRQARGVIHLYLTHGSKPEDFQRTFTVMDEAREEAQNVIMDSRFKMKELMTPEEWKAVFGLQGEPDAKKSN
jgi:hypothetical protein